METKSPLTRAAKSCDCKEQWANIKIYLWPGLCSPPAEWTTRLIISLDTKEKTMGDSSRTKCNSLNGSAPVFACNFTIHFSCSSSQFL